MPPGIGGLRLAPLPGAIPAWRASVDSDGLRRVCEAVAGSGGRLGALWASDARDRGAGFVLHAVLVAVEGLVCVDVRLDGETYADVSDIFPAAGRMQRAIADLMGLRAGMRDTRGWQQWCPARIATPSESRICATSCGWMSPTLNETIPARRCGGGP